jgi:hypothetical protein
MRMRFGFREELKFVCRARFLWSVLVFDLRKLLAEGFA